MDQYQELWDKIKVDLSNRYDEETYTDLFSDIKTIRNFKDGYIYVVVKQEYDKNRINRLYINMINDLVKDYTNERVRFKFLSQEESEKEIQESKKSLITPDKGLTYRYDNRNLNKSYTFDNFVVGKSNNFAFRMAMKVADQPGRIGNPLYIFGDVGLGKTHLMQAVGNYIIDGDINYNLLYIKADTFIEDYTSSCKKDTLAEFNEKYRNLDVLLIDDIQILGQAKKTQMEFFKLFDILFSSNKQIVITSDRPAKELTDIMSRLTSRFSQGLMVDIQAPDLNHRIDILKKKLSFETADTEIFPDDTLEYIAQTFPTNIRELEGALKRVLFYCVTNSIDINIEHAREALEAILQSQQKASSFSVKSYEDLQSVVAGYYHITVAEILGKNRSAKITLPRHIAMYLLKNDYNLTYKQIGNIFSRDHSTIITAVEKIDNERKNDSDLQMAIESIRKKIHID